jgi:hypothetical protein
MKQTISGNQSVRYAHKKTFIKLIEIAESEFDYSKALTLGIENSTGDLMAVFSAHAIPCQYLP